MLQESILQYFWPALSNNRFWNPIFGVFFSGRLRQVLLYNKIRMVYCTHEEVIGFHFQIRLHFCHLANSADPTRSYILWHLIKVYTLMFFFSFSHNINYSPCSIRVEWRNRFIVRSMKKTTYNCPIRWIKYHNVTNYEALLLSSTDSTNFAHQ